MLASSPSTPLPSPLRTVEQHCKQILRVIEKIQATIQPQLENSNTSSSNPDVLSSYPQVEFVRVDLPTTRIQEKCSQIQSLISQIHTNLSPSPAIQTPIIGSARASSIDSSPFSMSQKSETFPISNSSSKNQDDTRVTFQQLVKKRPVFVLIDSISTMETFKNFIDSIQNQANSNQIKILFPLSYPDDEIWKKILSANEHYEKPPAYYILLGKKENFDAFQTIIYHYPEEANRAKILGFLLDVEYEISNNTNMHAFPAKNNEQETIMVSQMLDQFQKWKSQAWVVLFSEQNKNKVTRHVIGNISRSDLCVQINVDNINGPIAWDLIPQGEYVHFVICVDSEHKTSLIQRIQNVFEILKNQVWTNRKKRSGTIINQSSVNEHYWTISKIIWIWFSNNPSVTREMAGIDQENEFLLLTPTTTKVEIESFFENIRNDL